MSMILIVTATLAAPTALASQAKGADAPTLADGEYQKLAAFVGSWAGNGSLSMGGSSHAVSSRFECSVAPGGVALACVHRATIEGLGEMVENALFGLDPATGEWHWYNVNTMGETHDHTGAWTTAERVEWRFEGDKDGQPLVERIAMDLGAKAMTFRSETTVGGASVALFEGTLKRQ